MPSRSTNLAWRIYWQSHIQVKAIIPGTISFTVLAVAGAFVPQGAALDAAIAVLIELCTTVKYVGIVLRDRRGEWLGLHPAQADASAAAIIYLERTGSGHFGAHGATRRPMTEDIGKLVLRLTVGVLMLLHGIFKLQNGIDGIAGMLASQGLPTFIAYGVYLGEVLGPALVIIGLYTRVGGLLMFGNMLVALWLAHANELFELNKMGGWAIETQALFLYGALAIVLLGAGKLSVGGAHGRYN